MKQLIVLVILVVMTLASYAPASAKKDNFSGSIVIVMDGRTATILDSQACNSKASDEKVATLLDAAGNTILSQTFRNDVLTLSSTYMKVIPSSVIVSVGTCEIVATIQK